jgi:hypothetical protein
VKAPTHPATTRSAVNHELFLLGYKNLPVTGFSQMVLSSLTVLASRSVVSASVWTWWLTYMLLAGTVYWYEFWNFRDYAKRIGNSTA